MHMCVSPHLVHVHKLVYVHTDMLAHTYACVNVHTHTHACTHIHTHTHTHTHMTQLRVILTNLMH